MTKIIPCRDSLQTYFYVVFSYLDGLIPLRSFPEKGADSKPMQNSWIPADDNVVSDALTFANLVAQKQSSFFVIPGVVAESGQASGADILQMQCLLIDIDEGNTEEKLATLEAALGEPTLIVESGGVTAEGFAKLHIYWQLIKAVSGTGLQLLLGLRYQVALATGGDIHFKSAHQPIRVAGSVYYKGGTCRLVKIRIYNPIEYELGELLNSAKRLPRSSINIIEEDNNVLPFQSILTSKVYEGGNGEQTRFNHLTRVIGYWLRRCHEGLISEEEAIEEIHSYNLANVVPSWPLDKIKDSVKGLWQLHVQKNGEPKKETKPTATSITSYSLDSFLADNSKLPEDIISPRILTPGGMFVFGGAPKVGKSDFLLSLFVHMAAGKEFVNFVPPRPLKIFYFQAEIGYHYLRERLRNMQLPNELINMAKDNLYITPNSKLMLDEKGIEAVAAHIQNIFSGKPDIIAVDPIRNVFDGGRNGATENENDAMLFFLQKRIEALRDMVNPEGGIVLAHHTKKITRAQFDEDPFQAFSGASSLRSYYTTGALLYKPDIESNDRHLIFELRNGSEIPTKILHKHNGQWIEESSLNRRITHKTQGKLFDRERERRIKVTIGILEAEALKGKFYLMKQFAQKFQNHKELGSRRAIYDDCSAAATQGLIKFFDNTKDYGLKLVNPNSGLGFMCTEEMKICKGEIVNNETGEIFKDYKKILPTHYKQDGDGKRKPMPSTEVWQVDLEEIEAKNVA